jgi:hypothetical protein
MYIYLYIYIAQSLVSVPQYGLWNTSLISLRICSVEPWKMECHGKYCTYVAELLFQATMELEIHLTWAVSVCQWTHSNKYKYWSIRQNCLENLVSLATLMWTYVQNLLMENRQHYMFIASIDSML